MRNSNVYSIVGTLHSSYLKVSWCVLGPVNLPGRHQDWLSQRPMSTHGGDRLMRGMEPANWQHRLASRGILAGVRYIMTVAAVFLAVLQTGLAADDDEEQWRRWVDERLVRLLTVNIYRTAGESWQTFKYITDSSCNFGFFEAEAARIVGASMMWGISGRLRKKYDIQGDVREELYKAANSWVDAVGSRT